MTEKGQKEPERGINKEESLTSDALEKRIANLERQEKQPVPDWFKDDVKARIDKEREEINRLKESLEQQEPEKQLIDSILKKDGITIMLRLPIRFGDEGYRDYSSKIISDVAKRPTSKPEVIDESFDCAANNAILNIVDNKIYINKTGFHKNGVHEYIGIRPLREEIAENIKVSGKKGFLGIGKTPDTIKKRGTGTYRDVMQNEIVDGGKNEAGVQFCYWFGDSEYYTDHGGRPKECEAKFILPQSTARKLQTMIDKDPSIVRRLVEATGLKIFRNPEDWVKPTIKPGRKPDVPRPAWEQSHLIYVDKNAQSENEVNDAYIRTNEVSLQKEKIKKIK